MKLREMKGLGPASEQCLIKVGIHSPEQLHQVGAVAAFMRLREQGRPSLNFLYALVGAIEDRHWMDIAREEKGRLLLELEGIAELQSELAKEGRELKF
ncbi:TfoX/Sxy family protein [Aliiglaciecola sp. CAU 1673]|uniref:TfoX/Sxy family protein n=1 Tax=Aliiglaciecola sp. CAU 1673 TaxID=3032595 RepID=UPI0023DB569B|nr:TfoX/Sxy family protein [Aliiglaciecola sp. CAU 1673]MDF2179849.1 TfoX/Sxy family protein [Aliiglaciecola sp. CAU 1673]